MELVLLLLLVLRVRIVVLLRGIPTWTVCPTTHFWALHL